MFREFVCKTKIPTVAATAVADLFPVTDENYYGNFGVIGGRVGNFMVQNADCLLILGARLSLKQIGFQYEAFSPNSYKIMVDVDELELQKKTIKIDYPICMDLLEFFTTDFIKGIQWKFQNDNWRKYCDELRNQFPIYQEKYEKSDKVNPYYFTKKLYEYLGEDALMVLGNSCACDMFRQMGIQYEGQRVLGNINCGTMGYDLPGALGACVASQKRVYCITGDGSIMMNLQELQTIVHNNLPIKIFIHNNEGYEAIVTTHTNFFGRLTGCTRESGISFPNFEVLFKAFGIPYYCCKNHDDVERILPIFIESEGYGICEIWSDEKQQIEPKSKSKLLENGMMCSPPLDDLYPFLEEKIYKNYANYVK